VVAGVKEFVVRQGCDVSNCAGSLTLEARICANVAMIVDWKQVVMTLGEYRLGTLVVKSNVVVVVVTLVNFVPLSQTRLSTSSLHRTRQPV